MKKKRIGLKIYLTIMGIFLIIIIGIWTTLWLFLSSYEKSNSDYIIKDIVNNINDNNYKKIIKYVIKDNIFYNEDNYLNLLKDELSDKEYLYRLSKTEDNLKEYTIYDKDNNINFIIALNPKEKKGMFNQKRWEISSISNILPETETIDVIAPSDKIIYLNGVEVSDDFIVDNNYVMNKLQNISSVVDVPKLVKYEISNIYSSEVNLTIENNTLGFEQSNNIYYYIYPDNQELLTNLKSRLNTICENYTRYVIKENTFYSLSPYVLSGTKAYSFLAGISNTNLWSGEHTKAEISEITYSNIQMYNDNLFSIDADYKYSYYVEDNYKEFNTHLTLYMTNKNNNWYLVDLNT